MTDRLSLIMQLGALATDAAQRGDDRAAATLRDAAELLFADKSAVDWLDEHRRRDRERKPRKEMVQGIPRNSTESAEIQSAPSVFPHTPFPTPPETKKTTPRVGGVEITDNESLVEMLTGEVASRMGEYAIDADEFVKRREYSTWKAWLKEILTALTGGNAIPADIAQVCRDDAALVRPIGSPKGFRTFVGSAVLERQNRERTPASKQPSAGADVFAQIRALVRVNPDPRQGNTRYIPMSEVEKLGPDALRAYKAIGGAARVLAAVQKPETIGFLIREFSDHYSNGQRGAA